MILELFSGRRTDPVAYLLGALEAVRNDEVCEVLGGKFELSLQYPVSGRLFGELRIGRCITAPPNGVESAQPFRIYRISKAINGWVTVYARHISCLLNRYVCTPFLAETASEAVAALSGNSVTKPIFQFSTDLDVQGILNPLLPVSMGQLMGSSDGCILSVYGGEWEFDRFHARLLARRGQDRGVEITYGLNMTDYLSDTQPQEELDGIYAYYLNEDGSIAGSLLVMAEASTGEDGALIEPRDYTDNMDSVDIALNPLGALERLAREELEAALEANDGTEKSFRVSFELLARTEEYKHTAIPSQIGMGDIVHVASPMYLEYTSLRVTEIRYQPTQQRYKSVVLGQPPRTIVKTILKK